MNIEDMNKNLVSVNNYWQQALMSEKENNINEVRRVCSEQYKTMLEQSFDTNEYYYKSANIPFEYSLLLNLFDGDSSWTKYYISKTKKISSKVRNYLTYNDQQNPNNNSALLYTSSEVLVGFAIMACVDDFNSPTVPKKEILLEGLMPFSERLESSKSKIPFEEKERCILASVMALLSDEYELAAHFLSYCKNFKQVKQHYSIFNQITDALICDEKLAEDPKIEADFFNIFNSYRLPGIKEKVDVLGDFAITNDLVPNYLFAWLYLKLFKGETKSSWKGMRILMMG